MKNKSAFTLVELLVVIAIIGIISTLAVVSLVNARQSARDAKRIADIKQIQTALELYYQDNGEYPTTITDSIATSGNIYMQSSPIAPTPADGDCSDTDNVYTYTVSGTENSSYSLTFCLGSQINDLSAGIKEAIPGGITSLTSEGSESGIWQLVGAAGFSNIGTGIFSTNSADDVRLSFYNGTPYVAFIDNSYGYEESCGEYTCYYNGKITVMKYNGSTWENVGDPGFSSTDARSLSFFIYGETPYIAYSDSSNFYKATVMKYNGSTWENVGDPGFSADQADSTSIYVYNGILYVAFIDWGNEGKITVMKYDGSTWENVGNTGFSTSMVEGEISLFVYSGIPYVAYKDSDDSKTVVKKFNGSTWDILGNTSFPESSGGGGVRIKSLFIDNGNIYLFFCDGGASKGVVKKYFNDTWETVGTYGFTADEVEYNSIYVYNGTPYVAYFDYGNFSKVTVMKYDGSTWENVGDPGFSDDQANYISIYVYNGIPYVAYSDAANNGKVTVMKYN